MSSSAAPRRRHDESRPRTTTTTTATTTSSESAPTVPMTIATSTSPQQNQQVYSTKLDHTPLPKALESLPLRISFFFKIWAIKIVGTLFLWYQMKFNPRLRNSKPGLVKRYPCRPNLPVHIYFPPGHQYKAQTSTSSAWLDGSRSSSNANGDGSNGEAKGGLPLLPLYINIHGGGLLIGTAALDDSFCTAWAARTGMLVVSLNYHKTPTHPFPTASNDIVALTSAILADTSLLIDHERVVIGGFSAGGLLSLSATQIPPLKGKVKAAVVYYPVVDFSEYPITKFNRRLDKSRPTEMLHAVGGALDWGYVCAGQNRKMPVLSPCYAAPEDLPDHICVVAAQYDMFCREARDMIFELAGKEIRTDNEEWKEGFEENRYKWIYAAGMKHGFTEELGRKKGPRDVQRKEYCDRMFDDVHRWLLKNVL